MFINHNLFSTALSTLFKERYEFSSEIKNLVKTKKYPSFVLNYLILTGNRNLITATIPRFQMMAKVENEIKDTMEHFLKDFREYDLELLKTNFQNKYGLEDDEFEKILNALVKEGKIKIDGELIITA